MRTQSRKSSEYVVKKTLNLNEIGSLIDHIQDEDHSHVSKLLDVVAKDTFILDDRLSQDLLNLIKRVYEHIRFEKNQFFPLIRHWLASDGLPKKDATKIKRALESKFVFGWSHILEEFQELQESIRSERVLKNMDRLEEELYWYIEVESTLLFPILAKRLSS